MTLEDALARYPGAETYRPGDSAALNAAIMRLIRSGRKTASCAPFSDFGPGGDKMLEMGRVDIALDWEGRPALATRTLAVERLLFIDMDAARVPPQGEFSDLEDWRRGYAAYFERTCGFDPNTELIYERFELVEDFAKGQCDA